MKSDRSHERAGERVDRDVLSVPCIDFRGGVGLRPMTVAEYDAAVQHRPRGEQVLWARVAPPVEKLTTETEAPYGARITDPDVYDAQMRALIGL